MFVYADAVVDGFTEIVASLSVSDGSAGVLVESNPQGQVLAFDGFGAAVGTNLSTTAFPIGRWTCLEWAVEVGTPGTVSMWIDDAPISGLQTVPRNTPPIFDLASLTLSYQATRTASVELWQDEVIIDGARIGCVR